jgi:hypothetical protein
LLLRIRPIPLNHRRLGQCPFKEDRRLTLDFGFPILV